MLEDSQLPLEQKKRKILRNLRNLEQASVVTATNKYQDVINDIAKVRVCSPALVHVSSRRLTSQHGIGRISATKDATDRGGRPSW